MKQKRLCGYQPQYFPRLHYMNRILESDVFEISDYVQFVKKHAYELPDGTRKRGKSFQAHTVIKHAQGPLFLAVPTQGELLPINKTAIDYSRDWVRDHLKSIEVGYSKAPNFERFYPEIEQLLKKQYASIGDLSIATTMWEIARFVTHEPLAADTFTIQGVQQLLQKEHPYRLEKIFLASDSTVPQPTKGKTNEWCIELCNYAGASEYMYGGTSHNAYMDLEMFKKAGITTVLQQWHCHEYPQQYYKAGFIPNLSAIDLVMNLPLTQITKIIKGQNTYKGRHTPNFLALSAAPLIEYETLLGLVDVLKLF